MSDFRVWLSVLTFFSAIVAAVLALFESRRAIADPGPAWIEANWPRSHADDTMMYMIGMGAAPPSMAHGAAGDAGVAAVRAGVLTGNHQAAFDVLCRLDPTALTATREVLCAAHTWTAPPYLRKYLAECATALKSC